ncbi:MAG: response regulator, partial [Desulfobacterales bacterium]
ALDKHAHDLGERIKELNYLYGLSKLVEKPDISLEDILQGAADLISPAWQYPEITCGRIRQEGREYLTENFRETTWKQTKDIIVRGETIGSIEVYYLEEKPEIDEGPFLKEERSLIDTIAEELGRVVERIRADEALRANEERLARSRKMESLGLMAGGIAHDLNNILSGVVSYPELLLMDLPEDSPLRKPIKIIQESGMRAVDVVADLMTIARGVATGKETLNLNTVVTEYLGSAEHQKLEKTHSFIDFKVELDSDLLNLSGSFIHINKALMNLVTNAGEAIEGGGIVTISTANRYLDEPLKGYEDVRKGEYAILTVSDDGSGISPQDLERIFEPFYTKKVMGRSGTGLGLAVVWNTVQDHDGYINVKTSKKGTAFELYFPVTREEVAAEKEGVPLDDYLGHGEKILVVDDEERQREIACAMLTKLGYTPESVSSGEEAIEYVKENPVDLIVLDMVMPKGINGRETYEEVIKIRPGQKAIIASGFSETKDVKAAQKLGAGKYIKKPYTMAKIGIAVKEELEK